LAFRAEGGMSPGTSKTMVMNINRGSAVRRDGRIKEQVIKDLVIKDQTIQQLND